MPPVDAITLRLICRARYLHCRAYAIQCVIRERVCYDYVCRCGDAVAIISEKRYAMLLPRKDITARQEALLLPLRYEMML